MQLPSLSMEYKTHSLCYKKRLPSVDAIESEKKRKIRTRKREPKQATKILHACEVDKGIIESVIEENCTQAFRFYSCSIEIVLQSFNYMVYSAY